MKTPPIAPFIDRSHDHHSCIAKALRTAEDLCQRHQQRFTAIRRRVLEIVWRQHKPIGAYQVLELLQKNGRTAPPTVYRALDFLQQLGLVHRIASLNAYVGCSVPGEPHDSQFLICESCHALAELEIPSITRAIAERSADFDFEPRRQTVEIMGLCPGCREEV